MRKWDRYDSMYSLSVLLIKIGMTCLVKRKYLLSRAPEERAVCRRTGLSNLLVDDLANISEDHDRYNSWRSKSKEKRETFLRNLT